MSDAAYDVTMDLDGYNELYLAQRDRYTKKMGTMGAVLFTILVIISFFLLLAEPSMEALGCAVLFLVCLALDIVMLKKPQVLVNRSGEIRRRAKSIVQWFLLHGMSGEELSSVSDLKAHYTVTLSKWGFEEKSDRACLHVPWFCLREKPLIKEMGAYFAFDDKKNSSVIYNMIGINWAFRDESAVGALFVPKDVLEAHSGLIEEVSATIKDARHRAKGKLLSNSEMEDLASWVDEGKIESEGEEQDA